LQEIEVKIDEVVNSLNSENLDKEFGDAEKLG